MSLEELEQRMVGFLQTDYDAYFFLVQGEVVGYALVKSTCDPLYLRQFLIDRKYRRNHYGTEAFRALVNHLNVEKLDLEVLPWNEAGKRFWQSCGFSEISCHMSFEQK